MANTTTFKGYKVKYEDFGKGPVVILLHGFGEAYWIWEDIAKALSKKYRVIVPDLPGFGESELPNQKFELDYMANMLKQVLNVEGIEECTIIGHSMGGYVALSFADKYPEWVKGLGLVHSTAAADSKERQRERKKTIDFIKRYGTISFMDEFIPDLFTKPFQKENKQFMNSLKEKFKSCRAASLLFSYEAMMKREDHTVLLARLRVPILFVIGKEDTVTKHDDVIEQTHIPETSSVHVLENVAHMGMIEAPEKTEAIIIEFADLCNSK